MLFNIDPALNADVLYVLRAMGHGDEIVVCDTNFPADSIARETVYGSLLRMDRATPTRTPPRPSGIRVAEPSAAAT